jgi:RNA polymerase sigma factor (sigma-70 family)
MTQDALHTDTLVRQSIAGDKKALNELVAIVQKDIYHLALRMQGNMDDAMDATQEILIKIITHLSTFKFNCSFTTWCYRVAVNYLLNEKKRRSNRTTLSFERLGDYLETGLSDYQGNDAKEKKMLEEEVQRVCTLGMVQCLSEQSRIVFILGEILEFDSTEGAGLMNISSENFRQLLSRARKKITDFTYTYCGKTRIGARCSCDKAINRSIAKGLINADLPRAETTASATLLNNLDGLLTNKAFFQQPPSKTVPAKIMEEIRKAIQV